MNPVSSIDIWMAVAAATGTVGMLALVVGLIGDRSRGRRRCPKCWYSMAGVPGLVCPECGRDARVERRLFTRRRRWRVALLGLALVLAGVGGYSYRVVQRDGVWEALPFSAAVHVMPWYSEVPQDLSERIARRLQEGPIYEWQRRHLYSRMGRIIESPAGNRDAKILALRMIENVSWRGGYNGRPTGEAAGAASTLIAALDDPEPDVRRFAVGIIASIGGDPAPILAAVAPMMDTDPDAQVRMHAVGTVGQLGNTPEAGRMADIMPRLKRAFAGGNQPMQIWCIDAAGKLGRVHPDAVAWLIERLDVPNPTIVVATCGALKRVGPDGAAAAPTLARLLRADDPRVTGPLADALRSVGDPADAARKDFLEAVKARVGVDEVFAAYEFVYRGKPGTIDDLLEASGAWTPQQAAFASALACDRGADAHAFLPLLERAVRTLSPASKETQWTGVYKWAFVGGCRDASLLEFLPPAEAPRNPGEVWRAALRGRIAGDDAGAVRTIAGVLAQGTEMTASWTRAAAADALGYFGEAARHTAPLLRELLKEEAWEPRERAREALVRITGVTPPDPAK